MDPIQIQRLVDGELSFEETQVVLQSAQASPELWETIAAAFVENQVWQKEFSVDPAALAEGKGLSKRADGERLSGSVVSESVRWLALAASLMLAVSLGFLVGDPVDQSNQIGSPDVAQTNVDDTTRVVGSSDVEMEDLNQQPVVYRMQVQDPNGNRFVDSDVPLYPVRSSEFEKYIDNSAFTNNVRREAARSGFGLQHNVRYLSGQMKDGRRFVIPVRKYQFYQGQ
jgi:hypothetical protein